MSTSWLTGTPVRSRALQWPPGDEVIQAGIWDREGTSLLDGLILHWFSFSRDAKRTIIYMADASSDSSNQEGAIVLSPITKELEYAADRVALVGSNQFASAEWVASESTLNLRVHRIDGSLEREVSTSVQAAYGDLRVFGSKVYLCISSGPTNTSSRAETPREVRLGIGTDTDTSEVTAVFADEILEWDTASGVSKRIKVLESMTHTAQYTFLDDQSVALAGLVDDQGGQEQLALTCFKIDSQPGSQAQAGSPSFSPGGSSYERGAKGMGVGTEGSSQPSSIVVHSFDRVAVFNRAFFSTEIPDNPRTGHLHFIRPLLLDHDIRVLPFSVPSSLPAIANDRVLVYRKISGKYRFYILDFAQNRVNALLNKTAEEREILRAQLTEAGAHITVVTRQSYAQEEGVGGGSVDTEYPIRRVPPEWRDHLRKLVEQEKEGISLIYDEAPEGRRTGRWGYVQSELHLGKEISLVGVGRMAITTDCVLLAPEPGDSGIVWYFE